MGGSVSLIDGQIDEIRTCKDCIHYDVCPVWDEYFDEPAVEGNRGVCRNFDKFKDKSHFVELPCKVGTELYLSDYIDKHHRLKEYKFLGNRITVVIECWEFQTTCTRWLDDFGKTIFLTKGEAEAKLKELQN